MSQQFPPAREQLATLVEPAYILLAAVRAFFAVIYEAIFEKRRPFSVLNIEKIRDESFARFWNAYSVPTPPGQELKGSAALVPPLFASASGRVLHVGPGNGTQVSFFDPTAVTHIYGAEPNTGLHAKLQASIDDAGLARRYTILPCKASIESLTPALAKASPAGASFEEGVFDAIIFVRVLCGIPNPEKTARDLYALLRPGGRFLICEHVVNPWHSGQGSVAARVMQTLYMLLGWSFFVGDCRLTRDTAAMLRGIADADGGWQEDAMELSLGWSAIPYISGHLRKRGGK